MPLLTSPIDGSPMKQINRYGIEIDVCPTTGGIWLDKGELEKLMALLKEDAVNEQPVSYRPDRDDDRRESYARPYRDGRDYDDDDYYKHHKGYKKKSKMSRVMDIFDF